MNSEQYSRLEQFFRIDELEKVTKERDDLRAELSFIRSVVIGDLITDFKVTKAHGKDLLELRFDGGSLFLPKGSLHKSIVQVMKNNNCSLRKLLESFFMVRGTDD